MQHKFDSLMKNLSVPVNASENNVNSINDNVVITNEIRKRSQTLTTDAEEPVAPLDFNTMPETEPINVPYANESPVINRKCANFPYCQCLVSECKGWTSSSCLNLQNGSFILPTKEVIMEEKRKIRNENKRLRMRESRKKAGTT